MVKMMRFAVLIVSVLFLVAGCGGKDTVGFRGTDYPATSKVIPTFQPDQVPVSCRVFSQLLVWLPRDSNGKSIAEALEKEAMSHGADMVLIGESRQAEDDNGLKFVYYGPDQEYKCRDKWCGWKFGYDVWGEQGAWVTLGYKEWGNGNVGYEYPIVLQAAFLRCQE